MDRYVYYSASEEETHQLGIDFASQLNPGDVVAFYGELGSGKTEFIKGICSGMKVRELVSSPTYTLMNEYTGVAKDHKTVPVCHMDLYRIESPGELAEAGLAETIEDAHAIKLIEWAEHGDAIIPPVRYDVHFYSTDDENGRRIEIVHREGIALATNGNGTSATLSR